MQFLWSLELHLSISEHTDTTNTEGWNWAASSETCLIRGSFNQVHLHSLLRCFWWGKRMAPGVSVRIIDIWTPYCQICVPHTSVWSACRWVGLSLVVLYTGFELRVSPDSPSVWWGVQGGILHTCRPLWIHSCSLWLVWRPGNVSGSNELNLATLRKCVVVFFDDILVYSNTYEEHISHLDSFGQRLMDR